MENYVKAYSIGEAWILSVKAIIANGVEIADDKGSIIEVVPFFIEMVNAPLADTIILNYGDKKHLSFLNTNFNDISGIQEWGYSYAQRLYSFNNVNQIDGIIQRLKKNPFSKSASINLLLNEQDTKHKPCLTTLDFKIRNSALIINAFFRSQDIGNKMYGDALELLKIGKKMNDELGLTKITLIHIISSAHIYSSDCAKLRLLVTHV